MTQEEREQRLADARAAASMLVLELERAGVLDQRAYPVLWGAVNKLFFALGSDTAPPNNGPAGPCVTDCASESMMEQIAVGEATSVSGQPEPGEEKPADRQQWHELDMVFAAVEAVAKRGKRRVEPK